MDESGGIQLASDPEALFRVLEWRMPFGKYAGRTLIDLPQPYLVWFAQQGWPAGTLGEALALTLEIKHNGLEAMVRAIPLDQLS